MKHLLTTLKLSVSGQEASREIMGVTLTVGIRLSLVSVRSTGLSRSGPFIPGCPGCSLSPTKGPPGLLPAKPLPPLCLLCRGSLCLLLSYQTSILCLLLFLLLLLSRFSRVRLCVTPETAAHQAPPSLGFSRQEHWSGLPFPPPMHESEKGK